MGFRCVHGSAASQGDSRTFLPVSFHVAHPGANMLVQSRLAAAPGHCPVLLSHRRPLSPRRLGALLLLLSSSLVVIPRPVWIRVRGHVQAVPRRTWTSAAPFSRVSQPTQPPGCSSMISAMITGSQGLTTASWSKLCGSQEPPLSSTWLPSRSLCLLSWTFLLPSLSYQTCHPSGSKASPPPADCPSTGDNFYLYHMLLRICRPTGFLG